MLPAALLPPLLLLTPACQGSLPQRMLMEDIFTRPKYNPLIRPVQNATDIITVSVAFTLFQVILVEERTQVLKTNNWIQMIWNDYQLQWKPEDYGGIDVIRLPCTEVWKPDVVLLNNADGKYEVSYCCQVLVYSNGLVTWQPPAIFKSSCTIDVHYFPFDQQECNMLFGSWTFNKNQVQLAFLDNKTTCDLTDYVVSGAWDVIGCPGSITNSDLKKYSEIDLLIILRRKTLFYTVNLLTPCVLISFLSVLTFYLPATEGEKITLCISILLALVVFLLLVSKSLPPTSVTMPLISKYLFFTFIMNVITTIVTVYVININFRSSLTYKMPGWMRIMFLKWLPVIMMMKRPEHEAKYLKCRQRKADRLAAVVNLTEITALSTTSGGDNNQTSFSGEPSVRAERLSVSPKILRAARAIDYIVEHIKNKDYYDEVRKDWTYMATVMDRFLLWVFLTVTVAGTVSIIVDAPHIFEVVDQKAIIAENMNL